MENRDETKINREKENGDDRLHIRQFLGAGRDSRRSRNSRKKTSARLAVGAKTEFSDQESDSEIERKEIKSPLQDWNGLERI
jgi:hypothetical protein